MNKRKEVLEAIKNAYGPGPEPISDVTILENPDDDIKTFKFCGCWFIQGRKRTQTWEDGFIVITRPGSCFGMCVKHRKVYDKQLTAVKQRLVDAYS